VKSNRKTAMPAEARRWDMRLAAMMSFEQVKQWAKMAVASIGPLGLSKSAARLAPVWPVKVSFSLGIVMSPWFHPNLGY
jgi:hypothetical protein